MYRMTSRGCIAHTVRVSMAWALLALVLRSDGVGAQETPAVAVAVAVDTAWVRVFEAGVGSFPPLAERVYRAEFDSASTRYIAVELSLRTEPADAPRRVAGRCIVRAPDGTEKRVLEPPLTLNAQWRSVTWVMGRAGSATPGDWRPGRHTAECTVEGEVVSASFEVTQAREPGSVAASPSREELARTRPDLFSTARPIRIMPPPLPEAQELYDEALRYLEDRDFRGEPLARRAAELGMAEAYALTGFFYSIGGEPTDDEAEAARWYQQGADLGEIDAMWALAGAYRHGTGVPADTARGNELLRRAAESGHVWLQYVVGSHYYDGRGGFPQDFAEAARFFRMAVENRDTTLWLHPAHRESGVKLSAFALARLYMSGNGVPLDNIEAVKLLWRVREVDTLNFGVVELGRMYEDGRGVARDLAEARRIYLMGGNTGDARAALQRLEGKE